MNDKSLTRTSLLLAAVLNFAVTALALTGAVLSWSKNGVGMLHFYTVLSNLFGAATCAVDGAFLLRRAANGREVPATVRLAKYMSVCCLTVTFLVVVFVLAPMMGGYTMMLLRGEMLYHHLLCPLLALATFFLFDALPCGTLRAACIALVPTVLYAFVAVILNIAHLLDGPYPFLRVYNQPVWMSCIWFVLIVGGAFGIAALVARLKNGRGAHAARAQK